jgi:putative ABC transport system permease protein
MESEMDAELLFHMEAYAEDLMHGGVPRAEALRRARLEFGGVERAKEECREARGANILESMIQDVRYGLRMLAKKPGFTAVAILTLALGIGANTAIFSVVNAVLLRPLPFPEPERLVSVHGTDLRNNERGRPLSYPDFADLRAQTHTLQSVAVYDTTTFTLTEVGEPVHLQASEASPELFALLRATPEIGRLFTAVDDEKDARVVILSDHVWRSRFGADPNIQNRQIKLSGKAYSVAGVMPPQFQFPLAAEPMDFWTTTASFHRSSDGDTPIDAERGSHFLKVIGRLKSGVTLEQANAELASIGEGLANQFPDTNRHLSLGAQPESEALVGDARPALLMVLGAVSLLLLIACANIANLLLARAASRQQEISVRVSMGAGRGRVVRQLLTESVLLSLAGGVAGLIIAVWGTRILTSVPSIRIPRLSSADVDWRALGFTLVVSVITGLLFGVVPALHSMRFDLFRTLKDGGRTATEGVGRSRMRGLLVIGEVSLAVVLLIGASLLLESTAHLLRTSPGFDPHGVLTFNIDLPDTRYGKPEQSISFYKDLIGRIRALPGVQSASGVLPLPMSSEIIRTTFEIQGRPIAKSDLPRTQFRTIALGYFQTMRIPLIRGRDFSEDDDAKANPVVIINQTLARQIFPNEDPIGKHIKPGVSASGPDRMREIVGIVGDVKHRNLWQKTDPESYVPYDQTPIGSMIVVVRSAGDPMQLLPAVREQVHAIDAELPVYTAQTLEQYVSDSLAQRRFTSVLLGVFAGSGLLLAIVGLFGVVSYSVEQRTHELGVRLAVGAERGDILKLVLGYGMRMTAVGIAAGIGGTLAVSRVLASQLYGVTSTDPVTFITIALILLAVALAACYVPARRATRVDPMVALRYE